MQVLTKGSVKTPQGVMFMHPFTGAHTDTELAAIGNYMQHQFGGRDGTITPAQIAKQRTEPLAVASNPSS